MINYKMDNDLLILDSNKITFQYAINKVEEVDGLLVVLLKNFESGDIQYQPINNIYAIDSKGKIVWNINDIVGNNEYFPGFSIQNDPDGKIILLAIDCMGKRHMIDFREQKLINAKGFRF